MTTQPKSRPTHIAYIVEGEGEKALWTEIGAMWSHEDGQGFNLTLKALPVNGRLVIRKRKEQDGTTKQSSGR
ncbi:hypothetical protein [Aestuariivirga litoralis]|uniref:hypothetical protein n=1 Tax=Aestuariivirga litoralis TaxID=2650924 RepID=UPI0018C4568E|nr:hypothetical protein [Aestuariivirga litoralis]MBG1233978.1 hypothetical protein [Aestuariivirga litoralis]